MTPRFLFRPAAIDELRAARAWYEAQRAGLGDELGEVVARTLDRIATQPGAFPEVVSGVRRAVVSRFPYGIFHRRIPTRWKSSPSFIIAAIRPFSAVALPYDGRCR